MKTPYQLTIIERIKTLRTEHNESQAQLAAILGISTGQMGNIETPKASHKYTLGQIYTLCRHFQISVADIFLTTEDKQLPTEPLLDKLIQNIIQYE